MKAVVFKAPFELSVEEVADPRVEEPLDAVIRITTANICGSDLHPYEAMSARSRRAVRGYRVDGSSRRGR